MIIAGAGGHAKEVLGIFSEHGNNLGIRFFDDVSTAAPTGIFERYEVLRSLEELKKAFKHDTRFVLGIGKPALRKALTEKLVAAGGTLSSIVSPYSRIGKENVALGEGLNIMTGAVITQDIIIGTGSLVHINVTIHHDVVIGDYCELSPGCHILGKAFIGDGSSIGAGAVVLPGIKVGKNAVIGAGAVVTKNVADNAVVKGIPAK